MPKQKKKKCQANSCDVIIKEEKTFCIMHWAMLDPDLQDDLIDAYTPGQSDNYKLKTKRWYTLVVQARYFLIGADEDDEAASDR